MKLVSFSILTLLSLLYAFLTYEESIKYQTWEEALKQQNYMQTKIVYFQRLDGYIYQLLRRMTIDSQHDPALKQLLKQNGVKVTVAAFQQIRDHDASSIPTLPTMPPLPGSSAPTVSAAATTPDATPTPTPMSGKAPPIP